MVSGEWCSAFVPAVDRVVDFDRAQPTILNTFSIASRFMKAFDVYGVMQ